MLIINVLMHNSQNQNIYVDNDRVLISCPFSVLFFILSNISLCCFTFFTLMFHFLAVDGIDDTYYIYM